ncbi:MAG TPA: AMP-binding protein [Dehalococcoidales bacterium]|nr:AMP-binding protein [Dehalococcoidales bacterium]
MPTIIEMLERNARKYPDDVALIELRPSQNYRQQITWQEFDDSANKIANYLRQKGIKKDDKVIHWMRNSIPWLVSYFGILKTGAWAVPLNFRFNTQDFKYCADIAEASAMIFEDEFTKSVLEVNSPTIKNYIYVGPNLPAGMVHYDDVLKNSSSEKVDNKAALSDICGLYFTSGTTGQPKPILLTHKNMSFAAKVEQMHHNQTRRDNFIILPPLYHTGAKMHWFGSLIAGAKGTILTEFSPQNVLQAVSQERGTIVWLLVPWVHDILVALDKGEIKLKDYNLKSWRLMHIGAQPVPPALVQHWWDYFPTMSYDNNYGLSESTGPGAVHLGLENEFRPGAVGKVGWGWQLKIVHSDDNRNIPPWMVGELCIKGPGVMKGYYKNSQLSEKTVVDGWLHTGDMARIDKDGYVYLVDRKKDVIIVGGENIYPIEIEDAVHKNNKVYDVAVIGIPDKRLVEIVAAVIDPKPGETLTEDEINLFIEGVLPKYKRPRKIIFDKVPRNATGKIEKTKLRMKYGGSVM